MEDTMTLTLEAITRMPEAHCCGDGKQQQLSPEAAQQFTDDLLILAHPIRIQILTMLARSGGQVCVCDIKAALPVKQPTVSHHLRLLRDAGVIDCERHGLFAYYFVNRTAFAALRSRILEPLDQLA